MRATRVKSSSAAGGNQKESFETDVLVVGNVAEDLVDGAWVPGGPSLYAGHVARALGARVTLLTTLTPTFDVTSLGGLAVIALEAGCLPRYENTYNGDGSRTQLLHATGEPIPADEIAAAVASVRPGVVYFAPAYHELDSIPDITSDCVVAASVQGPLRARHGLKVVPTSAPEAAITSLVAPDAWLFFSTEDAGSMESAHALGAVIAARGASAIVTNGDHGIAVFRPGARPEAWSATPARTVVDPTGAGDTFATSFLIRLAETGDEHLAIRFALAASSLAVERRGVHNIPTRAEIESRALMAGAA